MVSYVNTTAAVKAESDYCCTSSNARAVIDAIPADRQILFLPDMFLGLWLQRVTGRKLTIWLGECHVHAGIRPADVEQWHRDVPGAELLIHPECGCTSQVIEAVGDDAHILSTEGMVTYAEQSTADSFLIATEVGILHRLEQKAPGKRFVPVNREAVCQYMKLTTLEKVRDSLLLGIYEIDVPAETAARARVALERMIAIALSRRRAARSALDRVADLEPRPRPAARPGRAGRRRCPSIGSGRPGARIRPRPRRNPGGRPATRAGRRRRGA